MTVPDILGVCAMEGTAYPMNEQGWGVKVHSILSPSYPCDGTSALSVEHGYRKESTALLESLSLGI